MNWRLTSRPRSRGTPVGKRGAATTVVPVAVPFAVAVPLLASWSVTSGWYTFETTDATVEAEDVDLPRRQDGVVVHDVPAPVEIPVPPLFSPMRRSAPASPELPSRLAWRSPWTLGRTVNVDSRMRWRTWNGHSSPPGGAGPSSWRLSCPRSRRSPTISQVSKRRTLPPPGPRIQKLIPLVENLSTSTRKELNRPGPPTARWSALRSRQCWRRTRS